MNDGLSHEVKAKIRGVLTSFPEVKAAILYGSRAMGTYKSGSDIDITLKGDGMDLSLLNQIRTQLDDLLLPYTIDLSIYHHIDDEGLLDHIRRVGKPFLQDQE